jgi:hypothetical protein
MRKIIVKKHISKRKNIIRAVSESGDIRVFLKIKAIVLQTVRYVSKPIQTYPIRRSQVEQPIGRDFDRRPKVKARLKK